MNYYIWDKQTRLLGIPAEIILETRPDFRNDDVIVISNEEENIITVESKAHFKDLYNINLDIKLPNDLMINGKKIGGILTETKLQGENVKVLVIGVGINTDVTSFPKELEAKATSIKNEFNIEVANFWLIFRFLEQFELNFRSVF